MTTFIRSGLNRLANKSFTSKLLLNNGSDFQITLSRGIAGSQMRSIKGTPPRPKPWPYETKRFNYWHYLLERTTDRFDENTKIVVVEGTVASGKTAFAKELAKDLDMLYLPEANLDMFLTNHYGFNLKKLDDQLPDNCKSFDVLDFLKNPKHSNVATFQMRQYCVKYMQYVDALCHLLSTGQGVVLDRCVYSDFVFVEAMYCMKFISKRIRDYYYEVRRNTILELMRPHLVIYLDIPVHKAMENIKTRNVCLEVNSPAMTPSYLRAIEDAYKQSYLTEISKHSELLVYDWSNKGEVEVVIEDIERIDFDKYEVHDSRMDDWAMTKHEDWAIARNKYSDKVDELYYGLNCVPTSIPELVMSGSDGKVVDDVYDNAPGNKYQVGYNKDLGDKGILFKMGIRTLSRGTLPRIEREFK